MGSRLAAYADLLQIGAAARGGKSGASVRQQEQMRGFSGLAWGIATCALAACAVARPAWADDSDGHGAPSLRRTAQPAASGAGLAQASDVQRARALQAWHDKLGCVCAEQGQVSIDLSRGLAAESCPCPYAAKVRADVADALAGLSTADLGDKRKVAETLESSFVPLAPEYERVWRYPAADYAWWLDRVRCVCDGCKPTVFFSKCQLSCAPAIVYKLRARIFFAVGFDRDAFLRYYLDEYNADKPPRERKTLEWLLPHKQTERGWAVPALALALALSGLWWVTRRWSRRPVATVATAPSPDGQAVVAAEPPEDARLRRLRAQVQADDEAW